MSPEESRSNSSLVESIDLGEVRRYLSQLWHWIWLIILLAGAAAIGAFLYSRHITPVYQTTTSLLVVSTSSNQVVDYNSVMTSRNLVSTYSDILTSEAILGEVIERLNLQTSPDSLSGSIKVAPVQDTQVIEITIQGTESKQIANIANTLVAVFIDKITSIESSRFSSTKENLQKELLSIDGLVQQTTAELNAAKDQAQKDSIEAKLVQYRSMYATILSNYEQARLAEAQSTSNVVQISPAGLSFTQVQPKVLLTTVLAGILVALLATGFVIVREALDNTIKNPEEITHRLAMPLLGVIYKHTTKSSPVVQDYPGSPTAEAFRSLRTNIQYANVDHPVRSILVTSPSMSEGKTTISTNLALVLAQGRNVVTLVDADLRRPLVDERMNVPNDSGLTTLLLQEEIVLEGIRRPYMIDGLSIITAGEIPPNPAELLASKRMAAILRKLTQLGMVVLDSPPVLPVTDTAVLATLVDGVLLVIQADQTPLASARQAIESLRRVNANIIGVVFNNVAQNGSHYSGYYYSKGKQIPPTRRAIKILLQLNAKIIHVIRDKIAENGPTFQQILEKVKSK